MKNIIIIDDDHLVVESLKTITQANNINVVATGYNGLQAVDLYKRYKPDLILLDIRMDKLNGIDATKKIMKYNSNANILLITTFQDKEYILKAISLGCKGYILKENIKGIIPAIDAVLSGNIVFDSNIISKIDSMDYKNQSDLNTIFSQREIDILLLIVEGMNNKEISEELYLSQGTIRNYISNILDKLQLRDRTQLVVWWYKNYNK